MKLQLYMLIKHYTPQKKYKIYQHKTVNTYNLIKNKI